MDAPVIRLCRICGEKARYASNNRGWLCEAHHEIEQKYYQEKREAEDAWVVIHNQYEKAWRNLARAKDQDRAKAKIDDLESVEREAWERSEIASFRFLHELYDVPDDEILRRKAEETQRWIDEELIDTF